MIPTMTLMKLMTSRIVPTSRDCRWFPSSPTALRAAYRTNGTSPSTPSRAARKLKMTYGLYMM